jgi:hypothetical protein
MLEGVSIGSFQDRAKRLECRCQVPQPATPLSLGCAALRRQAVTDPP